MQCFVPLAAVTFFYCFAAFVVLVTSLPLQFVSFVLFAQLTLFVVSSRIIEMADTNPIISYPIFLLVAAIISLVGFKLSVGELHKASAYASAASVCMAAVAWMWLYRNSNARNRDTHKPREPSWVLFFVTPIGFGILLGLLYTFSSGATTFNEHLIDFTLVALPSVGVGLAIAIPFGCALTFRDNEGKTTGPVSSEAPPRER